MRILAIGENAKEFAAEIFQDDDIIIDWTDLKIHKKNVEYDTILSYMMLNRVPFREVNKTVKSWVDALKKGGELTLMVPSLEWAAVQILSSEKSPVLLLHLFGRQDTPNRYFQSGFTMLDLRALLSSCGVAVTHASTDEYEINGNICELHTVRGVKK